MTGYLNKQNPEKEVFTMRAFRTSTLLTAVLLFAMSGLAQQGSPPASQQSQSGSAMPANTNMKEMQSQLLSMIHKTNQMEIKAGQMAQSKSDTFQVREYGNRLVRDHTMADRMVTKFAKMNNIQLTEPTPQNPEQQQNMQQAMAAMQELQGLQGKEFDQKFLTFMEQGHHNAIGMLAQAHGKLPASPLKAMLNKMIPILTQHYEIASNLDIHQMAKGLGGGE